MNELGEHVTPGGKRDFFECRVPLRLRVVPVFAQGSKNERIRERA